MTEEYHDIIERLREVSFSDLQTEIKQQPERFTECLKTGFKFYQEWRHSQQGAA